MENGKMRDMKKKKWRWAGAALGMAGAISLSGCSLAAPEAGTESGEDRLIGAFITTGYLDLYDMEGYLGDHGRQLVDGGEVTLAHDPKYEGRLYAQVDQTEDGWEVSFGDVSGEYVLYPQQTDENGETYRICLGTEGICDIDTSVNVTDGQEEYAVSGTIYMLPEQTDEEAACHANPVYQTAEGDMYAVSGDGFLTDSGSLEGTVFSTTLSGEAVTTENGVSRAEKSSVTVRFAIMNRPVGIALYQMGQDHQIVRQDVYEPGKTPETLTAEPGAAYILVETKKEDLSGAQSVSREIVEYDPREETSLETFYALKNGIVAKKETAVDWNR